MRLIGIDLGGTAIKAGAVDERGEILERRSIPTGLQDGAAAVLDRMAGLARDLRAENSVGVGSPGLIDHAGGRVLECPNLKALENVPLRDELARRLGFDPKRVFLENDANAAAVGEGWLGAGRKHRDLLLVTLGTGVGGGLILNGELYAGPGGMAGEMGHVCIDPEGPWCGCGRQGCVEQYASATAARRRARELGLPAESPGDLEKLAATARARPGPERDLCAAIGRDLGRGLAMAVTLLDLRCFVVGGGFGAALDVLLAGVRAGIEERTYGRRVAAVQILPAELGADAGWIGAARLASR
ncbi:MAG: ROK family protein [Planctomycetota bacterium]|nr:ROK family protein [Planctomycetota bacterium]